MSCEMDAGIKNRLFLQRQNWQQFCRELLGTRENECHGTDENKPG